VNIRYLIMFFGVEVWVNIPALLMILWAWFVALMFMPDSRTPVVVIDDDRNER
jgi:ABC-type amino acid transport system permease subunit